MRRRIFVSHSSKGERGLALLTAVLRELDDRGYEPLADRQNLEPGVNWYAEVSEWMMQCEGAILLLDSSARKSAYVHHEISVMSQRWRTEGDNFKLFVANIDNGPIDQRLTRTQLSGDQLKATRISELEIWRKYEELFDDPHALAAKLVEDAAILLGSNYELTRRNIIINALARRLDESVSSAALKEAIERVGDETLSLIDRNLPITLRARAIAGWIVEEAASDLTRVNDLVEAFQIDMIEGRTQLLELLGFADSGWLDREVCPIANAVATRGRGAVVALNGAHVDEYTLNSLALRGLKPGESFTFVPCNATAQDEEEVAKEISAKVRNFTGKTLERALSTGRTVCLLPQNYPASAKDHKSIADLRGRFPNVIFVTWPGEEPFPSEDAPYGDLVAPPIDLEAEDIRFVEWSNLKDHLKPKP